MTPLFLGIDVGGTNIKSGVLDQKGSSLSNVSLPTEAENGPEKGIERICEVAGKAVLEAGCQWDEVVQVGLATPGTMDIPAGMLLNPPNLPGWINLPIRDIVQEKLGRPTILQNDANAAAYGEYWVGEARGKNSLVMWTLGTGIGCGIIVEDTIVQGEHSHGSECGHIIVEMEGGRQCNTGQFGTLEAYASAKSIVKRCHEAMANGRRTTLSELSNKDEKITPLLIAQAAEAGDELAEELIMDTAKYLGVGTTTLMHTINPAIVLFGGAMTFGRNDTELGRRFIERIRQEVRERAFPVPAEKTIIEYASLGGDAGYIGAAGCAKLAYEKSRTT